MATRIAWWLNLDAAQELEQPRNYAAGARLTPRLLALASKMSTLLHEQDMLLDGAAVAVGDALPLAFCPTPGALQALRELGFSPPVAPSLAVLRRVSCRSFATRLGQTLPSARYVSTMEQLIDHIQQTSPTGEWLLKRDFAFAGRERRLVRDRQLDVPTLGFARRSFARGQGLQVEPLLAREDDFAQHGHLRATGELLLGPLMAQVCDARGVWQQSRPATADELADHDREALEQHVVAAGRALSEAGYFGPFGVDAFRYRTASGTRAFQPRSEVNARFSMGYPRSLLERALAGERSASSGVPAEKP